MEANNSAAMREALIKARSAICQFARHQCQSLSWENSNIQANCGDVLCSWRGLCDAKTAINAALAAPPRNCDRFTSAEEAWDAYDEWVESYRANGEIPPFNEFGWLFAQANESEVKS